MMSSTSVIVGILVPTLVVIIATPVIIIKFTNIRTARDFIPTTAREQAANTTWRGLCDHRRRPAEPILPVHVHSLGADHRTPSSHSQSTRQSEGSAEWVPLISLSTHDITVPAPPPVPQRDSDRNVRLGSQVSILEPLLAAGSLTSAGSARCLASQKNRRDCQA